MMSCRGEAHGPLHSRGRDVADLLSVSDVSYRGLNAGAISAWAPARVPMPSVTSGPLNALPTGCPTAPQNNMETPEAILFDDPPMIDDLRSWF